MYRRTAPQSGFTLVEMLAAIAVGSAMLGVAVGVLHLLLRLERDGRQELRYRNTVARLSRQFRDDAHAAVDFQRAPPEAWQLTLPDDRVVRYECSAEELTRTELSGERPISREAYALGPAASVSIESIGDEAASLVRLKIVPDDAPDAEPGVSETQIDAVLGRDHRFIEPREASP